MTDEWRPVRSVPTRKLAKGPLDERVQVGTREATVWAEPGDFLLKEEDGNVYPISGDKFSRYYEEVDDAET